MTFSFSIALAVFQQFELTGANYLNMELQMENAAGKLFHSQPFSLALLASGRTTCFTVSLGGKASDHSLCSHRSQGLCEVSDLPSRAAHPACAPFLPFQLILCWHPGAAPGRRAHSLTCWGTYMPQIPLWRNGVCSRATTDTEFPS